MEECGWVEQFLWSHKLILLLMCSYQRARLQPEIQWPSSNILKLKVFFWGDSALSQLIILALSKPIFWHFYPLSNRQNQILSNYPERALAPNSMTTGLCGHLCITSWFPSCNRILSIKAAFFKGQQRVLVIDWLILCHLRKIVLSDSLCWLRIFSI